MAAIARPPLPGIVHDLGLQKAILHHEKRKKRNSCVVQYEDVVKESKLELVRGLLRERKFRDKPVAIFTEHVSSPGTPQAAKGNCGLQTWLRENLAETLVRPMHPCLSYRYSAFVGCFVGKGRTDASSY